jgi:hypothetical protein
LTEKIKLWASRIAERNVKHKLGGQFCASVTSTERTVTAATDAEKRSNSAVRRRALLARLPAAGPIPAKGMGIRYAEHMPKNV